MGGEGVQVCKYSAFFFFKSSALKLYLKCTVRPFLKKNQVTLSDFSYANTHDDVFYDDASFRDGPSLHNGTHPRRN